MLLCLLDHESARRCANLDVSVNDFRVLFREPLGVDGLSRAAVFPAYDVVRAFSTLRFAHALLDALLIQGFISLKLFDFARQRHVLTNCIVTVKRDGRAVRYGITLGQDFFRRLTSINGRAFALLDILSPKEILSGDERLDLVFVILALEAVCVQPTTDDQNHELPLIPTRDREIVHALCVVPGIDVSAREIGLRKRGCRLDLNANPLALAAAVDVRQHVGMLDTPHHLVAPNDVQTALFGISPRDVVFKHVAKPDRLALALFLRLVRTGLIRPDRER